MQSTPSSNAGVSGIEHAGGRSLYLSDIAFVHGQINAKFRTSYFLHSLVGTGVEKSLVRAW